MGPPDRKQFSSLLWSTHAWFGVVIVTKLSVLAAWKVFL